VHAALVVVGAGLVAASIGVSSVPARSNAPVRGWRRADLKPVTQPVALFGRFIFFEGSGRKLHLVALDARTGKTVWSRLASVSSVTPGVAPELDVAGSRVITLLGTSLGPGVATIAALDARTGKTIWATAPGLFTSTPAPCPGDATAVCSTGTLSRAAESIDLRFDVASGAALAPIVFGSSPAGRDLGDGLFDPALRNPEYLVAASGKSVVWRKPLAAIFGLRSTTDSGWEFSRVTKQGLFVGSVGFKPAKETQNVVKVDLSKAATAGFRISNGDLVWRDPGTTDNCGICNGLSSPGYIKQGRQQPEPTVGVALREVGILNVTISPLKFATSAGANVTIEGFDLGTGKTRWSFDAGHSVGLIAGTLQPPQTGASSILVRTRARRFVDLDLRTGAERKASASSRGWCRSPIIYPQAVPYQGGGSGGSPVHTITTYVGQQSLYPCLATGTRLPTPARAPTFVAELGATAGGVVAWSDKTGVTAVPAGG
jgi:outer membrane protein assembly factor BamB